MLNNKIFVISFVIKSYLNFWGKTSPFPKKSLNLSRKQFSRFSQKILLFSKKLLNKKIFTI